MSSEPIKIEDKKPPSEIVDRHKIIESALSDFLYRCKSDLSDQNFDRASRHLLNIFKDYEDLSNSVATNYLFKLFEYQSFRIDEIDKPDSLSDDNEFAEETLMNIIITADKTITNPSYNPPDISFPYRISRSITRFSNLALRIKALVVFLIGLSIASPFMAYYYTQVCQSRYEMGPSAAGELKELVHKIVDLEQQRGINTSVTGVWKDVKEHSALVQYGYRSSYKNFSLAQYEEAKKYLENRLRDLETGAAK